MIKGMTGFGTAPFFAGRIKGVIELKSVNHRFLDMAFYLPVGSGALEGKIRDIVSKHISRGRVTVALKITDKPNQEVCFNDETINEYLQHAKSIQRKFHLQNNLTLADLIKMPGVVEVKEIVLDVESLWPAVDKSLRLAIKGLTLMREREGKSLARDIGDKLRRMRSRLKSIEKRSSDILKNKQKILKADELASFQKGIDVNEEISRFYHYIDELEQLIKCEIPVGKKIDFIAQEMQRETNTLGSKLQDELVTNAVVSLKSKIEQIREQANNIE